MMMFMIKLFEAFIHKPTILYNTMLILYKKEQS